MLKRDFWLPATPSVSAAAFRDTVVRQSIVVVHFWAVWNNLDRQMDVHLQELRPEHSNDIAFLSFDTGPEEHWSICYECEIMDTRYR